MSLQNISLQTWGNTNLLYSFHYREKICFYMGIEFLLTIDLPVTSDPGITQMDLTTKSQIAKKWPQEVHNICKP
jgi:hypothetical protein